MDAKEAIARVREENAFLEGANQMREAVLDMYHMSTDELRVVLGSNPWDFIKDHSASEILERLNYKEELMAAHVDVGDIIKIPSGTF